MYMMRNKVFLGDNDELYICQAPLTSDYEGIGRRMQEKVTVSQAAKSYPPVIVGVPDREAIIISNHGPFKPTSKKKVDEITARLNEKATFAAKMRQGADQAEDKDHCPKSSRETRTSREMNQSRGESPKPSKPALKKSTATRKSINQGNRLGNNSPPQRNSQGTKNTEKSSVRFDRTSSAQSKSSPNPKEKKPGTFLKLLLDED